MPPAHHPPAKPPRKIPPLLLRALFTADSTWNALVFANLAPINQILQKIHYGEDPILPRLPLEPWLVNRAFAYCQDWDWVWCWTLPELPIMCSPEVVDIHTEVIQLVQLGDYYPQMMDSYAALTDFVVGYGIVSFSEDYINLGLNAVGFWANGEAEQHFKGLIERARRAVRVAMVKADKIFKERQLLQRREMEKKERGEEEEGEKKREEEEEEGEDEEKTEDEDDTETEEESEDDDMSSSLERTPYFD